MGLSVAHKPCTVHQALEFSQELIYATPQTPHPQAFPGFSLGRAFAHQFWNFGFTNTLSKELILFQPEAKLRYPLRNLENVSTSDVPYPSSPKKLRHNAMEEELWVPDYCPQVSRNI